jgi:hypothetical protein
VRELKMPVVTTFHTLLREPNDTQRRVMQELIARSTRLVVMTERGRHLIIPYGTADRATSFAIVTLDEILNAME